MKRQPTTSIEPFTPRGETPLRRHATFILVALATVSVWPYFERLNNPNENARVWMTRAIVEHHTMAIDRVSAEWGYVNDKATGRGHVYSGKAPGTSFLGVPVLWAETRLWHLFGWPSPSKRATIVALRFFAVMVPSIVFLFFFARWVERRTRSSAARDLLVVGLGTGTMLYPYGIMFVAHAQASMAAFAAFMLLSWSTVPEAAAQHVAEPPSAAWAGSPSAPVLSWRRIVGAGALTGASVMLEYQMLLIAALLAGYALWTIGRRASWFILAAVPFAIALGAYHTALFGRPWEFPYSHLENQNYAQIVDVGYHGLATPRFVALGTTLFSVSYGLFAFSPFLMLGLLLGGDAVLRGPRREGALIVGVMLVMTLFISGLPHWRGGWCVGPRYIAGVVPFLTLGLAVRWAVFDDGSPRGELLRAFAAGLIAASVFANGISAAVYPHYPEVFDNPIYDLAVPLVRDGYVSYGFGWTLGLPRGWSLLPLGLFLVTALVLAIAGHARDRRQAVRRSAGAMAVALVFSIAISRYGRAPSVGESAATATVRSLWQPPRSR
jgi:hypothetical protein